MIYEKELREELTALKIKLGAIRGYL